MTKVPINPNAPSWARRKDSEEARKSRRRGSSTNPATWTALCVATKIAYREGHGIGFAVEGSGLVGIDLDHVIREDGSLEPWAQEIVARVNSYTEISPSGDGLRIFAAGTIPKALKRSDLGLEMYVTGRYLTVTGERWLGANPEVEDRPGEVRAVFDQHAPEDADEVAEPPPRRETTLSDEKILGAVQKSKQATKFGRLFDGGLAGYPSESEADFALAMILAFWCGNDEAQIEGLMLASGRVRDKWRTKRGSLSWLQFTIRNAVQKNTQVYEPRRSKLLTWAEKHTLRLTQADAAGEAR
jgi:primase-polymerase (primpol)-like protein